MRRSKTITLAEAIKDFVNAIGLNEKLDETSLIGSWEEIVGRAISIRTSKIYIKNHILFVHLSSSVVRNELQMLKESLKNKLNEKAGKPLIKDIVFR
jgi:predicted nucleic acid-binding Zn ribbon protein